MIGSFLSLNPKADIFEKIRTLKPQWWDLFRGDKELYIDIRKSNYINVYYQGGSVANIKYMNNFVAKTHQKYLGDNIPRVKTKKGREKFVYDTIDLNTLDTFKINEIKKHIEINYSHKSKNEHPSEKYIQGKMINGNSKYIDSEFQFNQDPEIGILRIDLIELSNCSLSFIELKGVSDSRLRKDETRNFVIPEIIEQMRKYKLFIEKYEAEILNYYKTFLKIKQNLGLTTIICKNIVLNKTPKLIIIDTYKKETTGRKKRVLKIENLLETHNIDYDIQKIIKPELT